jgi:branched-chain amino acid transport system ATP-binding protein
VSVPASGADAALRVRDIHVRFAGVVALDGVSLDVAPGEVLALIGPNGAGKTTLFDAISGTRPPDSGEVLLGGRDVTRLSAVRRARLGLRRTFQRQQLFGALSVEDNLLCANEWRGGGGGIAGDVLGLRSRRHKETDRRAALDEVLEACGLGALRHAAARELTIGQARMLELGRALVDRPAVLLLDEPTSGLGEDDMERLTEVIEQTKSARRCAVVLVEHDITFVMRQAHRVIALERGEVIASGHPDEVRQDATVRAAYLT